MNDVLLDVKDLKVHFPVHAGVFLRRVGAVKAVDGVSFQVRHGETLGLVGESGCGKSTTGRAVINLLRHVVHDVEISGNALFNGANILNLTRRKMLPYRRDIQMIFQDPFSSLNPRLTVMRTIADPLKLHTDMTRKQREERVYELLSHVGMRPEQAYRYPHEFSGGQRQRICIARALATNPKMIIADEPVSALDVSIQAQVINLLQDLQDKFGLTYIFIAHDLSVVEHISDRIAVMYLGNIVEIGSSEDVYFNPAHPYSRALIASVPEPNPKRRLKYSPLKGEVPSPLNKPSGCAFRTRCPIVKPECAQHTPPLQPVAGQTGHFVACPYYNEVPSTL